MRCSSSIVRVQQRIDPEIEFGDHGIKGGFCAGFHWISDGPMPPLMFSLKVLMDPITHGDHLHSSFAARWLQRQGVNELGSAVGEIKSAPFTCLTGHLMYLRGRMRASGARSTPAAMSP